MRKMTFLLISLSFLFSLHVGAEGREKKNLNQQDKARYALELAHKKFLERKYKAMAIQLKKALTLGHRSQEIRKNALNLLSLAHQERGPKKIPVNWELPKEINYMKIGFRRMHNKMTNYTAFKLDVVGLMERPNELQQIKIVKYPKQLILDKQRGVGNYDTWEAEDGNGFYIGRRFDEIDFDGLYHIKIKVAGQEKPVRGWFIAESMKSSATPIIVTPQDGDVLTDSRPEFQWREFFSPEYTNQESRRLNLKVTKFDVQRDTVWELNNKEPSKTQARVGEEGQGVEQLNPGSYLLHVNYGERRRFGGLRLSRDSRTVVGFQVKN